MFTNIEGEWDEVMAVVKQAVEAVVAVSPAVSLVLKADIRPGHTGQLTAKVERLRTRARRDLASPSGGTGVLVPTRSDACQLAARWAIPAA